MKLKPLALVVALLAIAAGIVFWRNHRTVADPSADPRVGQPLVAAENLAALRGVRVVAGGQSARVTADAAGGQWSVPDYFSLPADFGKLVTLIESLRSAKISRFVTAQPERIERLGFAGDLIELRGADAKPLLTIHLGKNNESGGRFVRFDDEKKAYLVDLEAWLDAVPKNWARSQLLDINPENVASLEFRFADAAPLVAKRNADSTGWTADDLPAGKTLNASTIDTSLAQLTALRFTDTTEPTAADAVAAREHAKSIVVTLKDGTSYTVALGRRPAPPAPVVTAKPATPASSTVSATTAPITIGPDGKPQVAEAADSESDTANQPGTQNPKPNAAPAEPPPAPGPAFAFITSNRDSDPLNALMQKRAFQIGEWILNSLPADRAALLQDQPAPPPTPAAPATAPAP
ncbi:MAG TPA: DUF4340 domain-containing protein [Opitutaceae bacterium]|nr:DUF4340 domain-containing protein [Opitutaceae bacterium]